jgi:hypothetical protein
VVSGRVMLSGLTVTDEVGNPVQGVHISSASGVPYTTNGVLKAFADASAKLKVYLGSRIIQLKESFTLNADTTASIQQPRVSCSRWVRFP